MRAVVRWSSHEGVNLDEYSADVVSGALHSRMGRQSTRGRTPGLRFRAQPIAPHRHKHRVDDWLYAQEDAQVYFVGRGATQLDGDNDGKACEDLPNRGRLKMAVILAPVCTTCGHCGPTVQRTKGSFAIELILWLCFLIPGLIYSVWRLSTRGAACAKCGSSTLVPADSPVGQRMLQTVGSVEVHEPATPPPPPRSKSQMIVVGALGVAVIGVAGILTSAPAQSCKPVDRALLELPPDKAEAQADFLAKAQRLRASGKCVLDGGFFFRQFYFTIGRNGQSKSVYIERFTRDELRR